MTVTVSRGLAPCWSGSSPSTSLAFTQVSTRASQVRAPWSRRSRAVSPPESAQSGSVPGRGAARACRAVLIRAASSTVPRPRTRTPPIPSSVRVRYRPRCAERSSRSSAASSARAVPSGSSTSSRCSPALRSSEAFSEAAWSSSIRSASARSDGWPGSRSMTATITSACSGDTSPACNATRVAARSPHNGRAVRSIRDPWPCRPPAVWVRQSPGETQPGVLAASVASTSTATWASTAATSERSRSSSTVTSSRSSGRAAAHRVSASAATCSRAAATHSHRAGRRVREHLHELTQPGAHRQFSNCTKPAPTGGRGAGERGSSAPHPRELYFL